MWLEKFGEVDETVFFVFCGVAFVVLVLSLIGMFCLCCLDDPSPGHSLGFFVNLSTVLISVTVLFRGVQTTWAPPETFTRICTVYIAPLVLGFFIYTVSLTTKITAVNMAYNHARMKAFDREWRVTTVVWVAVLLSTALIVVWEIIFTPAIYRMDQQSTNISGVTMNGSIYECRGLSPDGDGDQFAWRVSLSSAFAFVLVVGAVQLLPLASIHLPNEYRANVTCYVLMILNALLSSACGLVLWFVFGPPDGLRDMIDYVIIGGLELWIALFSNGMVILSLVMTSRNCRRKKRQQTLLCRLTLRDNTLADPNEDQTSL